MPFSRDIVVKSSDEERVVNVQFEGEDLASNESLSTVDGTPAAVPAGTGHLTVSSPTVSGTTGQMTLTSGKAPFSVTADADTDTLTATGHGLTDGARLHLLGSDLPTGLDASTQYYVVGVSGDDWQLATSPGGDAVAFTSDGSGIRVAIDYVVTFRATTSLGQTLEVKGICQLRE